MAKVPVSASSLSGLGASNTLSNAPQGSVLSGVVNDIKQTTLAARALDKRLDLEFKRITINQSDILDADSLRLDTGVVGRLDSGKSGVAFDAYEVKHRDNNLETDPDQVKRDIKKEARQRLGAAQQLGKHPYEVTQQDIEQLGKEGRNAAINAITEGQQGSLPTDFSTEEEREFAVDVRVNGEGIYGRPLIELRNAVTGADINAELNTPAVNASYATTFNTKKRNEDIARIYAEREVDNEESKTRVVDGTEYRALSNKEADTFGGAVIDTSGRLLVGATGIIAMAVDLPLAGIEFMFDNTSATKVFKKDANGEVITVEDQQYLSTVRDIAQYQEQAKENRSAVAKLFNGGKEYFGLLTNNKNQEETVAALTKAYQNETFGRDFIGILGSNPKSVLEFTVDSLPFMYAAAKKGVAMPFAAAFTGENYKIGSELYVEEFGEEPDAEAKALILSGAAFIAALNSAGAKYVTGEWAGKTILSKIGVDGIGNFLKATSIRLGQSIPDSQLKSLSSLLLRGAYQAQRPATKLASTAGVEFVQEGSEGLITAASVRQSLAFTEDELQEASISGAIGFGSGGTAPIVFPATYGTSELVKAGVNGTRSAIKDIDLNKRASEFRTDINDQVVPPNQAEGTDYDALEAVRTGIATLTDDQALFNEEELATAEATLMRDVANLSAVVANMSTADKKANADVIAELNDGLDFIGERANADQLQKHKEIVEDLQSSDEASVQRGVARVLGSNEDALTVNDRVIDLAISKTKSEEQRLRLTELKAINKTQNEVAKEVMYGGANTGFIGVKNRQYIAEKLLQEGDYEGAQAQLQELRRFYDVHRDKAQRLVAGWHEYRKTGERQSVKTKSGQSFFVDGKSKNFIELVQSEVGQIAMVGKALAAKLDAEGAAEQATAVEERKAVANEPVNQQPQLAERAKQGDAEALEALRTVQRELLAQNLEVEAEQTENLITDVETTLAQRAQEEAETAAAAEVLRTQTVEEVADDIEAAEEAEAEAEADAAVDAIVETEVDKIIETELAPENTIKIESGESTIVDVAAEAQSRIFTPIQISAGDKVRKTFDITTVTLSSLFSRAKPSTENNAVEPLRASDRPFLATLDNQYESYRDVAKTLPRLIGKALGMKEVNGKLVQDKFAPEALLKDMASLLLVRDPKSGEIMMPDDVILASYMGAYNWMTHQARATLYNDDQLINQLLNQSPNADVSPQQRRLFQQMGSNRTFVAKTIGTDIFNSLGLQANAAHPLSRETMINSLGLFAIEVLKAQGLVEEHETTIGNVAKISESTERVENPNAAEFFIRVKTDPKDNTSEAEAVTKVIEDFGAALPTAKKLFNVKTYERRPTAEPKKGVSDIARNNFFRLAKIITDKVQRLQNVPWRMNATAQLTQQFDEDTLREMSGYVFNPEKTVHKAQRKAVIAVNRQIDDAIRFAREQMEEFGDKDFYLAYEVWGNSRIGVTSNTFNPQGSKYHRHITSPKSHTSRVSNKRVRNNFRLGITLAFEDLVKRTHPDFSDKGQAANYSGDLTEQQFNDVIQNEAVRAAVIAIRELKASGEQATKKQQDSILAAVELSGTKFHGLEALEALEVALDSDFNLKQDFKTTLSVETDGVTSGVILGLMQSPVIKNVQDWLARGGIFLGNYENLGEAREDLPTDAYQQLAVDMNDYMRTLPAKAQVHFGLIQDLIGRTVDAQGKPTSLGRKLMKSPLMVFSYGAGVGSIKRKLASEVADAIYSRIAEEANESEEDLENLFLMIYDLIGGDNFNAEFKEFKKAPLEWTIPKKFEKRFELAISGSIGEATAQALEANFSELLDQKKVLLQGLSIAFNTFKMKYDANVEKYKKENNITRQVLSKVERKAVLEMTKKFIPYFSSPYSTPEQQAVVSILTEEVIRLSEAPETEAGVFFSKDAADIPNYELDESLTRRRVKQGNLSASARVKVKQPAMDSVAALVKVIHTLDSTLILDTLTRQDSDSNLVHPGLNIHDAQMGSVATIDQSTKYYNQKVFQTSRDYNMVEDVVQMVTNTTANLDPIEQATVLAAVIEEETVRAKKIGNAALQKQAIDGINKDTTDMEQRIKWMNQVSNDVTAAKKHLFSHITAVAQAALPSQSSVYKPSGRKKQNYVPAEVDFSYHPGSYDNIAVEEVQTEERFLSSSEENMTDFEATYTNNATAETSQSIFNVLSHMGSINENNHHQRYLRQILENVINKALKPGEEFIVKVGENAARNVGDITGNTIRINLAPNRPPLTLQQSAEEIYIHELIHGLTTSEIENNSVLRKRLEELFNIAQKNLTPSDFLEEDIIENRTLEDDHQAALAAQARYDYIFNNIIVDRTQSGKNRVKGSNGLYEFIAFGLSNEQLVKKLSQIPYKQEKSDASNIFDQLVEIFNQVLAFLTDKFRGNADVEDNVYAQLYRLTEDIVGIHEGWRMPVMGLLNGAQTYKEDFEEFATEKLEGIRNRINRIIADDRSKMAKSIFLLNNSIKAARNAKVGPFVTRWLEKHVESDGFIAGIGRSLTGGSDRFKSWLPLLRYSKERIDTARLVAKDAILKSLKNAFKSEPSDTEKAMLHDVVLKTDLLSLLPKNPSNDEIMAILHLVEDEQNIDQRIESLLARMTVDAPTKKYYKNQSNNLGWFMATGKTVLHHANLNAYNIARKAMTTETNNGLATAETIAQIDELASLYALKYTKRSIKQDFSRFVRTELQGDPVENGVKHLLTEVASHRDYSQQVLFRNEQHATIKGFANEILDPYLDVQVLELNSEEAADLVKQGYELAFEMDSIGPGNARMGFYTAHTGAATTFQRTTFSTTSEHSKGTTLSQVYVKDTNGIVGRRLARQAQNEMHDLARRKERQQFTSDIGDLRNNRDKKNPLIPLVNSIGEPYEYRVILSHAQKEKFLHQDKRIDEVLGSMYASMSDKLETRKINYRVINDLYDDYIQNFESEPEAFVRIGKSGRYGDIWAVIPEQSKQQIKDLTGRRELYVRAELVDLVMGYRKLSVKDSEKFQKLPPALRGMIGVGERLWQETVALGAVQIVIKTPKVLIDNVMSNTIMLIRDNVSPKLILDKHLEGIQGLNDYYATIQEIHELNILLQQNPRNGANISKLAKAQERLKLNPVRPLVEAGIFQSITEDINVSKFTNASAFSNTKIGKAAAKVMPAFLVPVVQQAFMTKDTWLFQKMMKATQYSDFLARYTKYSYLTEKPEFKDLPEGPQKEAALQEIYADIVEDYINYDVPQSKKMQYVNDMGGIRFTKYFLRTQRVITKKWQQQPVNMALSWGLQQAFGDVPDITDSFIFTSDIMGKVNGPVGLIGDAITPKGLELLGLT